MATEIEVFSIPLVAGEDLSGKNFLVGKINSSGLAVVQTTAAAGGLGIIHQGDLITRPVKIMKLGTSVALYGGTVTAGDNLTNDATGKLVKSTASTDVIIAVAMESGVAGEQHTVALV